MKLLIIFIVLNIINVILQTVKSICTVKCGKVGASLVNAITFGVYTIVLVYMNCDLSIMTKAIIVAVCNLIGVYVVKIIEEKMQKDKLWKVEATIQNKHRENFEADLRDLNLPYSIITIEKSDYFLCNVYLETQKESILIKDLLSCYTAKFFVSESKIL